jgi:protein involved in polysaccharide export with SLBB domain
MSVLVRRGALLALAAFVCLVSAVLSADAQEVRAPRRDPYRISAGDLVEIRVFGQPDFSVTMRVPPEGTVSYPGIRDFPLLGSTISEAERELTTRLRDGGLLREPLVGVLVKEFAPRTVYVLGRVHEPGEYAIPVGRELLLSHALSMAKGFAEDADLAHVRVVRRSGGREDSSVVDFRLIEGGSVDARNMVLEVGDQILVPELRSAYVIGEVNKPGEVGLPAEGALTVSRVLSLAGSFNERSADLTDVKIYRRGAGPTRVIAVDVKSYLNGDAKGPEPTVEPDDLVYVPRRGLL